MAASTAHLLTLDALPPQQMAQKSEDVGVTKASLDWQTTFMLAVLAGAFIAPTTTDRSVSP